MLSRVMTVIAWLPFLLLAGTAHAVGLKPYEAVYESKLGGLKIRAKRQLEISDTGILVSIDARRWMFGVHESSQIVWHDTRNLRPVRYIHKRKGLGHAHDKNLVFEPDSDRVTNLLKPEAPPLGISPRTHDKLSYQIQMRLDLMRNPDLDLVEYEVTNGIRNRTYRFRRLGDEVLSTPLGRLNTVKFQREDDDDESVVYVWMARDWDYLLVRVDQRKKPGGKLESLVLNRATIGGRKVTGLQPGLLGSL